VSDAVTIEIFTAIAGGSEEFANALNAALGARKPNFTYKTTVFHIGYSRAGRITGVKAVLTDLNDPLPPVFNREVLLSSVYLRCAFPLRLRAKAGWYAGDNFGFPGAICCIDPKGEQNRGPRFYATGGDFASVVDLFKRVMAGGLMPGHNGNVWDRKVYRP